MLLFPENVLARLLEVPFVQTQVVLLLLSLLFNLIGIRLCLLLLYCRLLADRLDSFQRLNLVDVVSNVFLYMALVFVQLVKNCLRSLAVRLDRLLHVLQRRLQQVRGCRACLAGLRLLFDLPAEGHA